MMIVCTSWSWWEGGDPLEALLLHTARPQASDCSQDLLQWEATAPPLLTSVPPRRPLSTEKSYFQHLLSLQETLSALLHSWTSQKRRRSWSIDHCGQVRLHKDITWWSKCMWTHSCIMHVQQSVQSSVNRGEMSTNCAAGRVTQWPSSWDRLTTTRLSPPCLLYFCCFVFQHFNTPPGGASHRFFFLWCFVEHRAAFLCCLISVQVWL